MTELEKYKEIMVGWKDLYHQQEQAHKRNLEDMQGWANLLELGLNANHESLKFAVQTVLSQIKKKVT